MSSWREALIAVALAGIAVAGIAAPSTTGDAAAAHSQAAVPPTASARGTFAGIGRAATPKELAAWDIDVRADFKGLPAGSGSVAQGQDVWEAKCASCHGVFGESNEVFNPIVGGTTEDDIRSGHVARLMDRAYPGRTTLMKVATVSTLWDYIRRAMPWNTPKSLSVDEVYGVTAYILNLGYIVPDDFVLSDRNIAEVQQRMPNRNGMTTEHALWPGAEFGRRRPDVQADACMHDCESDLKIASQLPAFARNSHGNLAEQNRLVGAQRGVQTAPLAASASAPKVRTVATLDGSQAAGAATAAPLALLQQRNCSSCHAVDRKLIGPAFREIATKYAARADAIGYLSEKIRSGGAGVWGSISMPPQTLDEADTQRIAAWLAGGAKL